MLRFGLALARSFLAMPQFFPFWVGMFTLFHSALKVCNLLICFYLKGQIRHAFWTFKLLELLTFVEKVFFFKFGRILHYEMDMSLWSGRLWPKVLCLGVKLAWMECWLNSPGRQPSGTLGRGDIFTTVHITTPEAEILNYWTVSQAKASISLCFITMLHCDQLPQTLLIMIFPCRSGLCPQTVRWIKPFLLIPLCQDIFSITLGKQTKTIFLYFYIYTRHHLGSFFIGEN